jgi:outer membrane receptor protein involved in Fe transport
MALVLLLTLTLPLAATAQSALPDLSFEDLMKLDAGQVFGASERLQPVLEAPASVSFITADEIARYGYRTLADILRSVRGFYVTDDRNFSLIGVRGFAKPGDYNSRILLLINGHRVNDNVFGQAEIGAEFGLDPAMFARVEIIRGPASSLYGDSAFFAVVNVITRTGASLDGASVTAEGGTLSTRLVRGSIGRRLARGADLVFSSTYEARAGVDRLYFPAFDTPATNHGVATGLDGERIGQVYGRLALSGLAVTGLYGTRRRDVPTASFGTIFNAHDPPEHTIDRHTLVDADYSRSLGATRLAVRASFDRFTYDGTYPLPSTQGDAPIAIASNGVVGERWSVEGRLTRRLPGRQTMTAGAEFIDNDHQDQTFAYSDLRAPVLDSRRSSTQRAVYMEDEIRPVRWLLLNGGLRYDDYNAFSRVTPRAAVIVMPSSTQSFKYLYGRAFRTPNAYELNSYLFGEGVERLRPETIDTHELVWERYHHDWLRTTVSTYWYNADRLISLIPDPTTAAATTYVNQGQVRARGLELEAQMRLPWRSQARASYALQQATDQETQLSLPNSPRHLAKARLSLPGPIASSSVSLEALYLSSRTTLTGQRIAPAATANLTMLLPLGRSWQLSASLNNLFDAQYADPASGQNVQDTIPQNGRTARVGVRCTLWKP